MALQNYTVYIFQQLMRGGSTQGFHSGYKRALYDAGFSRAYIEVVFVVP